MELYNRIISIVDSNLIYCIIPIVLFLLLARLIFENRFQTKKALNIIRWVIIGYSIITLISFVIGIWFYSEDYTFTNRATGPYNYAYWLMLISASVLPFTLLIKRLGTKYWYVVLIAFFMKIGVYFERFAIITTSFHRDYAPEIGMTNITESLIYGLSVFFIQGFILSVIIIGILEIIEHKKLRTI